MKTKFWKLDLSSLFILLLILITSCNKSPQKDKTITVFCAASLAPVMQQAKLIWENEHKESIIINASSSGTLARQIEHGAKADLYFSANSSWTDHLAKSLNIQERPLTIASNQLVVAAPISSELDSVDIDVFIKSIPKHKGKISIGNPGHVPLGKYSKQFLEYYNIYPSLTEKLIMTKDARSALRLVELGEVEFGFIYRSDALTSSKVRIISCIATESHDPILYQATQLSSYQPVGDFLKFLISENLSVTWQSNGFEHIMKFAPD